MDEARVAAWERRTRWPLDVSAVLFLTAYAWPILQPALPLDARAGCRVATWATWAVFAVDFVVRVWLAERRARFVIRHPLDVAVIVLPLLRPLRLLRLVAMIGLLNRSAAVSLRGRVIVYVLGATALLIFFDSLTELDAERAGPSSNIRTFGDALWWAISTVTTVGYGDRYPVTGEGRLVAVALMIGGIALLGVVTAAFASWLVQRVSEADRAGQAATGAQVAELARQIAELRAQLDANRPDPDT